ncbi:stage 0 sporulation protein YaaT [Geobacter sp. OR-1]|uniref:PSP1 domain-containing protein n=1 Tax=Geobacter sp. OR-1 TaxID=1266765 RepID=UPI0005435FDA|nr:stage 0 sporulation family protein [Geobacter sp. OR-1]GAM08201.1 stage 0 sporulation protein YaaT [Geobacter sp. OR-1]
MRIVKVQFSHAGKLYDFNAGDLQIKAGDQVIVETERGRSIAVVVVPPIEYNDSELPEGIKKVMRMAHDEDLAALERIRAKEAEAFTFCQAKISERSMEMKLVKVEYLFDGSKAIFFFTADGRIDFRELVKDLAHQFHTRIEMRQIGVRDEAKMVGGIGICGRELCCSTFLRDFAPVSVKMAKEQNLALNPTKISGQCGRLLCCLGYEFETYCSLRQGLPKCGKRIQCGGNEGEVIKVDILRGCLTIKTDDERQLEVCKDELTADSIIERPKKPAGGDKAKNEHKTESAPANAKPRKEKRKDRDKGRDKSKEKTGEK